MLLALTCPVMRNIAQEKLFTVVHASTPQQGQALQAVLRTNAHLAESVTSLALLMDNWSHQVSDCEVSLHHLPSNFREAGIPYTPHHCDFAQYHPSAHYRPVLDAALLFF